MSRTLKAVGPLVLAVGVVVAAAAFDLLRTGHVHVDDGAAVRHFHPAVAAHSHAHDRSDADADHDGMDPEPAPAEPAPSDPPPRTIWASIAIAQAPVLPAPAALGPAGRAPPDPRPLAAPAVFCSLPLSRGPPA